MGRRNSDPRGLQCSSVHSGPCSRKFSVRLATKLLPEHRAMGTQHPLDERELNIEEIRVRP